MRPPIFSFLNPLKLQHILLFAIQCPGLCTDRRCLGSEGSQLVPKSLPQRLHSFFLQFQPSDMLVEESNLAVITPALLSPHVDLEPWVRVIIQASSCSPGKFY